MFPRIRRFLGRLTRGLIANLIEVFLTLTEILLATVRFPIRLTVHLFRRTGKLFVHWADRSLTLENRQLRDDNDRLRHEVDILKRDVELQVAIIERERQRVDAETAIQCYRTARHTTGARPDDPLPS